MFELWRRTGVLWRSLTTVPQPLGVCDVKDAHQLFVINIKSVFIARVLTTGYVVCQFNITWLCDIVQFATDTIRGVHITCRSIDVTCVIVLLSTEHGRKTRKTGLCVRWIFKQQLVESNAPTDARSGQRRYLHAHYMYLTFTCTYFCENHLLYCNVVLTHGLSVALKGKTTILYQMKCGEAVHTVPTVGFNVETVQPCKGVAFTVWDVGGQGKVRELWKFCYQDTDGTCTIVTKTPGQLFDPFLIYMDVLLFTTILWRIMYEWHHCMINFGQQ